ncbi:MAG: GFA family protein [Hyphomicrobiaceae bacterium]
MELNGKCHCGEVAYEIAGNPMGHMLCHCGDCRRHAGAPMVGWALFAIDDVKTTRGKPKIYNSSEHGRRHFCGTCGTGLFYTNDDFLPGIIDVRTATLDNPEALPPECHMQTAERLSWMEKAHELPSFERFPPTE